MQIGTRVWVKQKSKQKPSGEVRNVEVQNADDAARRRRYTYEQQVWRKTRKVPESGFSQDNVRWPPYVLGKNEEVRGQSESYKATFASGGGTTRRRSALNDGSRFGRA